MADEPQDSDAELMARSGEGDLRAFEVLVQRHQHAVVGTVAKMLGSHAIADDVAQEVFIRAWKSAPRYRPDAKFTTWLMTITRNLVFNEYRRARRASFFPFDAGEDSPHHEIPDPDQRPAGANVAAAELEQAIDAAIQALPEKPRLALVLRRYEEMPYEEIAVVLKMTVPAVKSLIFRARAELKVSLKNFL